MAQRTTRQGGGWRCEVKPLGIDLGQLRENAPTAHVHPTCPGASIRILKDDLDAYVRSGMQFTDGTLVPAEGYGQARVRCTNFVARVPQPTRDPDGKTYESIAVLYYGLCKPCSQIESINRKTLRERAQTRGDR